MADLKRKQWWLYVLRLEDAKFYVGITSKTPEIRLQEHIEGKRSAYWTAKHKPLEIIYKENLGYVDKLKAERRENKMTRELMKQRGLNNVRGGDLRSVENYIKRVGYYWEKETWEIFTLAICLFLVIIYLLIDKYFL